MSYDDATLYELMGIENLIKLIPHSIGEVKKLGLYYTKHPQTLVPALNSLQEAKILLHDHPSASPVFSSTSIEIGIKKGLVWPTIHGVVTNEDFVPIIVELIMHLSISRFMNFTNELLKNQEHLTTSHDVDFTSFKRPGFNETLWNEMATIRSQRNKIVHNGEVKNNEDAEFAFEVAAFFLKDIVMDFVDCCKRTIKSS